MKRISLRVDSVCLRVLISKGYSSDAKGYYEIIRFWF